MQVQTRTVVSALSPSLGWPVASTARPPRLSDADLEPLEAFAYHRKMCRGQELFAAGDPARFCYRVVSGWIRLVDLDEDGRRQIAEFVMPGELFGLDALGTHYLSAEALADTVVVAYPQRELETLAEQRTVVARQLREHALQNLRRAHERLFLLGRKTAGERIAAFLLEIVERAPALGAGRFELPMTRADIADHLGLTIETVSRNMAQLCRRGIIVAVKRGLEIRDRAALAAFGASGAWH